MRCMCLHAKRNKRFCRSSVFLSSRWRTRSAVAVNDRGDKPREPVPALGRWQLAQGRAGACCVLARPARRFRSRPGPEQQLAQRTPVLGMNKIPVSTPR